MQTNTSMAPGAGVVRGWAGAERLSGKSRVQLWRDVRAGRFPAPIELGPNAIGWFRAEIDEWLASRPRRTYASSKAAA
jgi:predicted DNA-binding transcriptional regulator AlpA